MRTRIRLLPPDSGMGWTPYAWLIYLLTFFIGPVVATREGGVAWWVWPATILGTLIFLASYFYGYWVHGRRRMLVAALHTALGVAFAPVNPGACVFFVYGASFAGMLHPSRVALRGVVAIALIGGVTALLVNAPLFFPVVAVVISLLVGSVNLHYTQRARVENTLRLAQREIQQLAAIAERERIARDLHDVLGHTLSMIVLKAELAARLAERDPLRAAREMRDVEQVARTTLQDVRLAIRGYRTTFAEELERSRSMLKAAHVAADFPDTAPQLPQSVDETLAFVLREAVTNIVRHAEATRCTVQLTQDRGDVVLEVADDGRGVSGAPGLGLRGLRERVEFMDGVLEITSGDGTCLTVRLPLPRRDEDAAPVAAEASRSAS